jgi:hypothetical protein
LIGLNRLLGCPISASFTKRLLRFIIRSDFFDGVRDVFANALPRVVPIDGSLASRPFETVLSLPPLRPADI